MNIVDLIFQRNSDSHRAIASPDGELTYAELEKRVTECVSQLRQHPAWPAGAVQPRIGLHAPSGPDYIVMALAILQSGACFVPVPHELTDEEQRELISRTALHAVIEAKSCQEWQIAPIQVEFSLPEALNAAFIRFSSGTTAQSKGVLITHEALLARITAANEGLKIGREDCVLWVLPMAHHFAVSIILYLYHGATTILAPASDPVVMLRMLREHDATVMYGSPYHFTMLAGQAEARAMARLRLAVSTAFALSAEVAALVYERTGLHLVQGMGIIEVGLPILNLDHAASKPTSIGKPLPAFEVRLSDGELQIRGPGMFDAYLSPWQPREVVLQDGWFATGDMAEMDADGCLYLRGRSRSVINVGGMKCFPEEIEAVLTSHPQVKAARVVGRPHPALGFVPVAEIVTAGEPADGLQGQLKRLCQQRLSAYKVPLTFRFVSELPLTASGKLRRY